ncbi:MAG: Sec-independent protein translocase subunit TatA/TatB [Anaerolineae bacterium]
MNFFNIGAGELFLVLILIIMVFGPQRLPEFARRVGKAVRDLRNFAQNIDPELLEDFREITRDLQSVRDEVQTLRSDLGDIQRDIAGTAKEMSDSVAEAVEGVREAATSVTASQPLGSPIGTPVTPLSGGAVAGASAAASIAPPTKPAPAAGTAASAAVSVSAASPAAISGASAVVQQVDSEGEIIGIVLPLKDSGDSLYPDEIIGEKVFPLARSAAHARASELSNGHDDRPLLRSRHAVMTSLVQKRPVLSARRATVPVRLGPSWRRAVPARSRRSRGG